ncbi:hypothetical protein F0521_39810 [Ferrimonas sp. YFM]|nr:hypothetical protein F0521_39810 [Ferrimonas sp. YFM]
MMPVTLNLVLVVVLTVVIIITGGGTRLVQAQSA